MQGELSLQTGDKYEKSKSMRVNRGLSLSIPEYVAFSPEPRSIFHSAVVYQKAHPPKLMELLKKQKLIWIPFQCN